jgi:hypothetical protein
MFTYNGNFPLIAYYIEDKNNTQSRVPFKCRKTGEEAQFFSISLSGLADTGTNLTLSTPKYIKYKEGSKVILDGIMYSVEGIYPYVPDQVPQGLVKRKINAYYLIVLS